VHKSAPCWCWTERSSWPVLLRSSDNIELSIHIQYIHYKPFCQPRETKKPGQFTCPAEYRSYPKPFQCTRPASWDRQTKKPCSSHRRSAFFTPTLPTGSPLCDADGFRIRQG